jgi:hypothetical protein
MTKPRLDLGWLAARPRLRRFEGRQAQHGAIGEAAAHDLKAHGQTGRSEPRRHGGGGLPGEIEREAEWDPAER